MRASTILLIPLFLPGPAGCSKPSPPPIVQITATELYKALQEDEAGAVKRFEGKALAIEGEVADTWGAGPPGAKPSVTFKVDSGGIVSCSGELPVTPRAKPAVIFKVDSGGIVHCSGDFGLALDKYQKGVQSIVTCPASTIQFSAMNNSLQMWDRSAGP